MTTYNNSFDNLAADIAVNTAAIAALPTPTPPSQKVWNGIDFGNRVMLNEEFHQPPALNADIALSTNLSFELQGTNATSALVTAGGATTNGWILTTAGANNDSMVVCPHQDAKQSQWAVTQWGSDRAIVAQFNIRTISNTDCRIEAGIRTTFNAFSDFVDTDCFFIRFDTTGAISTVNWVAEIREGGNTTWLGNSGIPVLADTQYRIVFVVEAVTLNLSCYVNGVLANNVSPLTASVALGAPYAGIKALAVGQKAMAIQKFGASQLSF